MAHLQRFRVFSEQSACEHVVQSGTMEFGAFASEHHVLLPHIDLPLNDVRLVLFGQPDPHTGEMVQGLQCEFAGRDITSGVVDHIRGQLERVPREYLLHFYRQVTTTRYERSDPALDKDAFSPPPTIVPPLYQLGEHRTPGTRPR